MDQRDRRGFNWCGGGNWGQAWALLNFSAKPKQILHARGDAMAVSLKRCIDIQTGTRHAL
jgi:hypothetical protein